MPLEKSASVKIKLILSKALDNPGFFFRIIDNLPAKSILSEDALLHYLANNTQDLVSAGQLRCALTIWKELRSQDRIHLLAKFQKILNLVPEQYSLEKRTVIFCRMFLVYMAPILSEFHD